MEVDPPTSSSSSSSPVQNSGTLKRSNSAPMINTLVNSQPDVSPPAAFKPATSVALRRLSSSNMALHNAPASTSPPIRGPDRVARIKQEEIHIADRERQHERTIQSSLWISHNWDNFSLDTPEAMEGQHKRPRSFSESLHIMTQSNILCGSPSPTRAASKQCFSPSMQIPVKSTTFTPSPSPSPTRKSFLRSLSPIAVRTGVGGVVLRKRKLENDGDRWEYISPPKKFNTGASTPDRIITCSHPLANSISSSSLEGDSPELCAVRTNTSGVSPSLVHTQRSPQSLSALDVHSPVPVTIGGHSSLNNHGVTLGAGLLASRQAFMFQPLTEAMGSPSSTSLSSSSSLSLHHLHPLQDQQQQSMHHHPTSSISDLASDQSNQNSNDIYMSDSEMRDSTEVASKPQQEFNFKPISPDHT